MIKGTKYWNDSDKYYTQENNPLDNMLRKAKVKLWLETCGPTSAVNIASSMGLLPEVPKYGIYRMQPESVVMDYFNDSRQYGKFNFVRDLDNKKWLNNEIPQYYPIMANELFGMKAIFDFGLVWDLITSNLVEGNGIQLCLKKPGHYIAAVAYDSGTNEIIYNDSHPSRFKDGKGGHNRRMTKKEFLKNVKPYYIIYYK